MNGKDRIAELLVETGAFRDLDSPTILTSGELGIYYINTEKLLQDDGVWVKHGDSASEMISYVNEVFQKNPGFNEVIKIIAEELKPILAKKSKKHKRLAISGGQRRDWLFSAPVASFLALDHISLYKQTADEDRLELSSPSGEGVLNFNLSDCYTIHIVDLITEGSSIYDLVSGKETGWVPMLRKAGVFIDSLFSVVTRKQGGEERLKDQGVLVNSFVSIDEDFLSRYSKHPQNSVPYARDPGAWSRDFIDSNGALMFLDFFNPDGKNLSRALKFYSRYKDVLALSGKLEELKGSVKSKYKLDLD